VSGAAAATARAEAAEGGAAARIVAALRSERPRLRAWAHDRLKAAIDGTEGPALAPPLPWPAEVRAAIAAEIAEAAARGAEDLLARPEDAADEEDANRSPDDGSEARERAVALVKLACAGDVTEAVEPILALLAAKGFDWPAVVTEGSEALARLGARGARPAAALRAACAAASARIAAIAATSTDPEMGARLRALDGTFRRSTLGARLRVEGAPLAAEALAAIVDELSAEEGEGAEHTFQDFARLLDGLHEASGIRGAVHAIALVLDAGEAPGPLAAAVPQDALLHAKKRSTPKLLKVALHALRQLESASDAATQATVGEGDAASDPVTGARAVAREALRLRERIEAVRGDRAKLLAVLLLAVRAKVKGLLPASVEDPSWRSKEGAAPAAATARAGHAPVEPREAARTADAALDVILDPYRGFGPALVDARRRIVELGDAALPALLARLDREVARGPLAQRPAAAADIVDQVASLGTRAAADALLARFGAIHAVDPEGAIDITRRLLDARLLDALAALHLPGQHRISEAFVALAELLGAGHPALAAMQAEVHARAEEAEEGLRPLGSYQAALDDVTGGDPARIGLSLWCGACGRTLDYLVEQGFVAIDGRDGSTRVARHGGYRKREHVPEDQAVSLLVVMDEIACKACGARDTVAPIFEAAVTAQSFLDAIESHMHEDERDAEVDGEHCPVREGRATDLLSEEEWPAGEPLDTGLLRAKFRERLAAFRADKEEGDPDARWPPELDGAWPGDPVDE